MPERITVDRIEHRVRSYELDPYRHVNNGAYINWLEEGRERFLRRQGRHYSWYPDELGLWFVVVKIDCDYLSSAVADEELEIVTRLARTGRSSVVFRQTIRRRHDGLVRSRARVVMAFAATEGGSVAIPDDFHERFEVSAEGDGWTEDEGGERG